MVFLIADRVPVPAREGAPDLAPPVLSAPARLSPAEVTRALRLRLRAMEDRDAQRQELRFEDGPREYDRPAAASEGPVPPDAPDGELEAEGTGGAE